MECEQKDVIKKEDDLQKQIQQLNKDKQRLEELMSLKDKEIVNYKEEVGSLKIKVEGIENSNEKIKKECLKQAESKYKSQIDHI
jgi:hypothetical protein